MIDYIHRIIFCFLINLLNIVALSLLTMSDFPGTMDFSCTEPAPSVQDKETRANTSVFDRNRHITIVSI